MSSISLSFLQSTCSYSNLHQQQKLFVQTPLIASSSSSQPRRTSLVVEAKARTRQDNRQARHARLRKKVNFIHFLALVPPGLYYCPNFYPLVVTN